MLTPWHYIAIGAPLLLLVFKGGGKRYAMMILFIAILLASAQAMIDVRIRRIRIESPRPISSLPATDPLRKRFGLMHGVSSMLLLAQIAAAAVVVARIDD